MMDRNSATPTRHLVIVLGDQLDRRSAAFDDFDPQHDRVWMAEVAEESTHVWSSKPRIVMFLTAMRHFRAVLEAEGLPAHYDALLPDGGGYTDFNAALRAAVVRYRPERLVAVEPGEWRVRAALRATARELGLLLDMREDRHFLCTHAQFAGHSEGRKSLRMEYFYREQRQRHGVLIDDAGKPLGGQWNYDHDNRGHFGKDGPGLLPAPRSFPADAITRGVIELVNTRFAGHPGQLDDFDFPADSTQAHAALEDFLENRLPYFGQYQDAMWTAEPWLYHSRLSAAMNLKLLDPRAVLAAAERAYREKRAPLAAVEGFIRQILGWREYVRGIYWREMPDYLERNALDAQADLPAFYWTGDTEAACLRDALGQTLRHGYAHHIQRLMVTGLYTMLLGVHPQRVHEWYLAVYVDAVEWVELPNTLGMSQHADGGLMASKPYAASGKYIQRMSNYCAHCPYDPAQSTGPNACPFTTLYWDFLARHEARFAQHPRMKLQVRNVQRLAAAELRAIRRQAERLRS